MMPLSQRGFTLISALVYIGLLAIVSALLARLAADFLRLNAQGQVIGEVTDNAQRVLEVVTQEIQRSQAVYTPTSVLDVSPGQLSLVTTNQLPNDETVTWADIFVDDGRLYLKREGSNPELITSERVRVDNFVITHLDADPNHAAVRLSYTITFDSPDPALTIPVSLPITTTISPRAY